MLKHVEEAILARSRRALLRIASWAFVFSLFTSASPFVATVQAADLTFRGQTIQYEGAEVKWIGDPNSMTAELLLIYRNTSGVNTFKPNSRVEARVLAIGGGGAGGTVRSASPNAHGGGGGGGAGEFVDRPSMVFAGGNQYTIAVGSGGAATGVSGTASIGENGADTVIQQGEDDVLRVKGGGGGGGESAGQDGGSGGGGSNKSSSTAYQGGAAVVNNQADGHACAGGAAGKGTSNLRYGGGGGGAGGLGGAGGEDDNGGAGGAGFESDIDPEKVRFYAGGGGGGSMRDTKVGPGGAGGGGAGGGNLNNDASDPAAGEPNTGSGGGGGGRYRVGAAGGSGIVILRLTFIEIPKNWTEITFTRGGRTGSIFVDDKATYKWLTGDDLVITYTNTLAGGGLKVGTPDMPVWANARVLVVGGGGGGGFVNEQRGGAGGGGGAGGVVQATDLVFDNSVEYAILTGRGGAGGTMNGEAGGDDGSSSSIKTNGVLVVDEALGGGGGGARDAGRPGASGGGGSRGLDKDESESYSRVGGAGKEGQGFNGGDATTGLFVGGGGGGAGGAGGAAERVEVGGTSINVPGAGGAGLFSDITGRRQAYAGGGGGAYMNVETLANPRAGGAGGSGVGGVGAGVELGVPVRAGDGAPNTGSGGGGGTSHVGSWTPGGNGADGVVIIRLSGFVVKDILLPTVHTDHVYDGTAKTGVAEFFAYDLTGVSVATNADVYTVTATIPSGRPYGWSDAGGDPSRKWGSRTFTWTIHPRPVSVPVRLAKFDPAGAPEPFDSFEKTAIDAAFYSLDADGYCYTNVVAGVPLRYCRLEGHRRTDAGTTNYVATLCNDTTSVPHVTNFCWRGLSSGSTLAPQSVPWRIAQAANRITTLTIANWQEGTEKKLPVCEWTWKSVTARYDNPDRVAYSWRKKGVAAWSEPDPDFAAPTEAGIYELRAFICRDSNHEPGNWVAAEAFQTFCVWRHPSRMLTDYVDITIKGYSGGSTRLENFPVLVRLREAIDGGRGGGLPGFSYARAGIDGASVRFLSLASSGEYNKAEKDRTDVARGDDVLLPHEIDTWDPSGESLIWVRVPLLANKTTKIRMYWHRNPESDLVSDLPATDTWTNGYIGVWHLNKSRLNTFENSAALGRPLDASGSAEILTVRSVKPSLLGNSVYAKGDITVPNYESFLASPTGPFTVTGWYRADDYETGGNDYAIGRKNYLFTGKKPKRNGDNNLAGEYNDRTGWCLILDNNTTNVRLYDNNNIDRYTLSSPLTEDWHHLAVRVPKIGSTTKITFIPDGTKREYSNRTVSSNTLNYLLVGGKCAADEVRLSNVERTDEWITTEYQTVKDPNFCVFGLVNRPDEKDFTRRVWVNWWNKPPSLKRYWDVNEFKRSLLTAASGQLFAGSVSNVFHQLPEGVPVDFPDVTKPAQYRLEFLMHNAETGLIGTYPGPHILFEGACVMNFEIIGHNTQPIAPGGADGATLSGRVLLANDDTDPAGPVSGQGYWRTDPTTSNPYWEHMGGVSPALAGWNVRSGTEHTLNYITDGGLTTNTLWRLSDVYIGNLMTNDDAVATSVALSNRWNALPWSTTSRAISSATAEAADGALTARSEVGQFLIRNVSGATIESQVLTNGIGTIYFDAANVWASPTEADALARADRYALVVEIAGTNETSDLEWERVPVTPLFVDGQTVVSQPTANELSCLNVRNGGNLMGFRFYRVFATVPEERRGEPLRFRLRRTGVNTRQEGGNTIVDPDDPDGFILIDNVIASWPAPVPRLRPVGTYDATLGGKQTLGMEGAFSGTSYPSPGAVLKGRARLEGGDTNIVTSARLNYRWRYLGAHFDPSAAGGNEIWRTACLNVTNGVFETFEPLTVREHEGDIEYYLDLTTFSPFYDYIDYSGRNLAAKTQSFAHEEPEKNIATRSPNVAYPSGGSNWFVRVRSGESPYRRVKLKLEDVADIDMELLGDHLWRGYYRTAEARSGGLRYRVEPHFWAAPGDMSVPVITNYWYAKDDAEKLPTSAVLETDGTTNSWAKIPCDATTGWLMFQLDDRSKSLSIVHADFQDFNMWDDAKHDDVFCGDSEADGKRKGVSPDKQEFEERFTYYQPANPATPWTDTPSSSTNWTETFTAGASQEFKDNVPFVSSTTLGGWKVGPGMYVYQWYKHDTKIPNNASGFVQRALQLEGCGKGWLQMPTLSTSMAPRGLGTISFKARLAQFIDPMADASYADPLEGDTLVSSDYTFASLVAFDTERNRSFAGNASLSLFAYYRARRGCYEFRYEQIGANVSGSEATSASNGRRLSLYRWRIDRTTGRMTAKLLGSTGYNSGSLETNGETGKYAPMFISCQNETDDTGKHVATVIKLGIYTTAANGRNDGFPYNGNFADIGSVRYSTCVYRDTSEDRLTGGTYGVLTSNSDGVFLRPHIALKPTPTTRTEKDRFLVWEINNGTVKFQTPFCSCEDDIRDLAGEEPWVTTYGRMETFYKGPDLWGLRASPAKQRISVKIAPRGTQNQAWETVREFDITSFGSAGKAGLPCEVRLDRPQDYDVRLETGGTIEDPRVDLVVDDIQVTQWRGEDYGGADTSDFVAADDGYGWRNRFTFSSAWVKDGAVMLSAKRTLGWSGGAKASAIRSPLMDGAGSPKRGIGLGSFSFSYRNAQENARLLVQIATNGVGSSAIGYDKVDDGRWTTVETFDFSKLTPRERQLGAFNVYLGHHGVKGLMRLVVDPAVVEAVSSHDWLDASQYGEVEITHVYCRDEPEVDDTAWTGWNLQTTDRADRMFLFDRLLHGGSNGLSLGLNRSTYEDVEDDSETYRQRMPYVQSPVFVSNTVGEVTFRARKYENDDGAQHAEVALYGGLYDPVTKAITWRCSPTDKPLARFVVSNTTYTTYTYKTHPGEGYKAFRLGVTGLANVLESQRGPAPTQGARPTRVLIDEVLVSEAIRPRVGFRSCRPIRSAMVSTAAVPDTARREEQPILGDAWSVQAEIMEQLLPDELDLTTPGHEPRVIFHWFEGDTPWGFETWRGLSADAGHHMAELTPADGEKMIFRGSYTGAPAAVVMAEPAGSSAAYRIYQYSAEVIYYDKNGNCITGALEQAEWSRPEWYAPLDLNRTRGRNVTFAAYNVLESVSPGRAWINEANLYDGRDSSYTYPAEKDQYVEIAVPLAQSLRNWQLRYVDNNLTTNLLCVFGMDGIADAKTANAAGEYVFLTVQSKATRQAKTYQTPGLVDGTWLTFAGSSNGELDQTHPIGLQLVRPSGIIAQEVVLEGMNTWAGTAYYNRYSAERQVAKLNDGTTEGLWYAVGSEADGTTTTSLSVTNLVADAARASAVTPAEVWTPKRDKTPGRINVGQVIPSGYAIYPSGDMIIINATVSGPHISQKIGDLTNTVAAVTVATKKDDDGTNIVYHIDSPWYEIDAITENGVVRKTGGEDGTVFAAGRGSSESVITVRATARPRRELESRYGVGPKNPYTPGILKWLEDGCTMKGAFAYPGNIELPTVRDLSDTVVTNLTLTEAYWFDIDPTGSNWCLKAGTSQASLPVYNRFRQESGRLVPDPAGDVVKTNIRIGVYMCITNRSLAGPQAGLNWSPYVLRGKAPDLTSHQYVAGMTNEWNAVNFKMTADMLSGLPLRAKWVPLRYFVFTTGSFDANHQSIVEIPHPFSDESLSRNYGWHKYRGTYPQDGFGYRWTIDDRVAPVTIETLAPTNAITW